MKKFFKWFGISIAVLIAIPVVIAVVSVVIDPVEYTPEPEMTQAQKDSVMIVELQKTIEKREKYTWTARNMVAHYEKNEIRADEDLKDKVVIVQGRVESIGKDIMGSPYITLDAGNFVRSVQCSFNKTDGLSDLNSGDFVTVKGKCDGLLVNVLISKSELLPTMDYLRNKLSDLQKE